ncbi:MAG: hypothetical protein H0U31_02495, partial [Chloroflexia bacterium]|nr:hypothetical protein [Chloroflexia bacterium]
MSKRHLDSIVNRTVTRRNALRGAAGVAGAAAIGGTMRRAATAAPGSSTARRHAAQDDAIIFLSTQLSPIEEAEAMRNTILANFDRSVDFITEEAGPYVDRITAEAEAGSGSVGVLGGLHGDLSVFFDLGLLAD